ncbi:TraB/GumN family protein [Luteimonas vadosa]|uniref:TraB/GumN family protein n=1 Tax=Luteimonas vadosa TaxID=1165507 RepID=A0ABP9DWP2_9GAMM
MPSSGSFSASAAVLLGMACVAFPLQARLQSSWAADGGPDATRVVEVPADPSVRTLETVVVSGAQPGPGVWKLRNATGHELWILGSVNPLPKRMEWHSAEVERFLARAEEVIWPPSLSVGANAGFFGTLALLPKAMAARNNPGGQRLVDVLPANDYARWQALKQRYLGRDRGVEKRRPMFAAMTLYEAALDRAGLATGGVISPVVDRATRGRKVRVTKPRYTIRLADPKAALAQFRDAGMDDRACLDKTMRRLETDLDNMVSRANAWATGDLDALRALPYDDHAASCIEAAMESAALRERGGAGFKAEMRRAWLEAAESGLRSNQVTFAVLPMRELLSDDGYLSRLQARGYQVQAPE